MNIEIKCLECGRRTRNFEIGPAVYAVEYDDELLLKNNIFCPKCKKDISYGKCVISAGEFFLSMTALTIVKIANTENYTEIPEHLQNILIITKENFDYFRDKGKAKIIIVKNFIDKNGNNKVCPNCRKLGKEEILLTEYGQTQIEQLYSKDEPLIKGYGAYEGLFDNSSLKPTKNETLGILSPGSNIDVSIQRHMYLDEELQNPNNCPKCHSPLKKEQFSFFVVIKSISKKQHFIIGCDGHFCKKCPVVVLEKNHFGDLISSFINDKRFGIHVSGIVDIDQIPEDKKNRSLEDIDPLPLVLFYNDTDKERHENFINDKTVFKPIINLPLSKTSMISI